MLWTSPLVGFVRLSDKFTTGSSIMPQKRNPDAAELVRAKTGGAIGALNALLIVMKGLPLAYQKDMQEDKDGAMQALSALSLCLAAMTGMVADMQPDAERMKAAAGAGYSTATDLADWLVRIHKIPFREAHHITGRIVAAAEKAGVSLDQLPLADMQRIEPRITRGCFRGAQRRAIGRQPQELRRYGTGKRHARSQKMAETAWQIGLTLPCCGRATVQFCLGDLQDRRWGDAFRLLWCGWGDGGNGVRLPSKAAVGARPGARRRARACGLRPQGAA